VTSFEARLTAPETRPAQSLSGGTINMPRWRKATWVLLIWNVLMVIWIVGGLSSAGNNCAGETGDMLTACQAGTAIGAGVAISLIITIWFIGFIVLGLIWLMSRPKENVVVFGPEGQQVTVSEKEAKRRVSKGWTYQPPAQPPSVS
jgi:hypothetical protein